MEKVKYGKLDKARKIEQKAVSEIPKESRPVYHLSSPVGWMNDPNGFSVYQNMYHCSSSTIHLVMYGDLCIGGTARARIL